MINKTDLILLLTELQQGGVDVKAQLQKTVASTTIPIDVLKFINKNRQLDLTTFYEKIRKSYNKKHSVLYKNIVVENLKNPKESLTTLSALLTQALLYSNQVENRQMFLKHARCEEISKVLAKYFVDYDLTNALKLLRVIKADLKVLESLSRDEL